MGLTVVCDLSTTIFRCGADMKAHPKTGRTIREEAEHIGSRIVGEFREGLLIDEMSLAANLIEHAILRYAAPRYTKNGNGHAKVPPDARVPFFIERFAEHYFKRRGSVYAVNFARDSAIVKRLLKTLSLEELQDCAIILLDERTDDKFIQESDRGIGMLSTKINWLNQRRAAFLAKQMRQR